MKIKYNQIEAIIQHLDKIHENDELEFKSAKGGLPGSFWETYSSFANTNGGLIILGIREKQGQLLYDALSDQAIDKLQKDLWSGLNNRSTVSINLLSNNDIVVYEQHDIKIIIVSVPRAGRDQRPVYVGLDPYSGTYKRGYEGDFKCNRSEIQRMFADADATRTFDKRILKGFTFDDIDKESLKQYRQLFNIAKPDHVWSTLDDISFLKKLGAYRFDRQTGIEGFTVSGILMFGTCDAIIDDECVPHFFPDYRNETIIGDTERWVDRVYPDGSWVANLFQFYLRVLPKIQGFLPKPFKIEGNIRIDQSPAHIAIREVFVNMLVHSDYRAEGSLVVRYMNGTYVFSNPGTMLVSQEQFFDGGESICRNPTLQNMFMMLGPAEKAGSGGAKIMEGWRMNNWRAPFIVERSRPDKVEFHLAMESLMQQDVIDTLNIRFGENILLLPSHYQTVLAVALTEKRVTNERLRYILRLHKADITILLQQMCKKGFLVSEGYGRGTQYMLPPSVLLKTIVQPSDGQNMANVDTSCANVDTSRANVDTSCTNVDTSSYSEELKKLLLKKRLNQTELTKVISEIAHEWLSVQSIASIIHKDEKYLKNSVIPRLIDEGVLEREYPHTLNHPQQRYRKK